MRQLLATSLLALLATALPAAAQTDLHTVRVASGLAQPLWAGAPDGDSSRLFIVEQNSEDVHILDLTTEPPTQLPGTFINISSKVNSGANERGLLGMAFDPDYLSNGFFYLSYTRTGDGASIVERYSVLGDPATSNSADATSGLVIFGPVSQPQSNHNGGHIAFGPDGKLYFGLGDGGSANDSGSGHHEPGGNSQWGLTLLGKMIRINSDGTVPGDNPFVTDPDFLNPIWAYGLRNPWRFSFDRETGDLYIGDVGQNAREEVDVVPASSTGGENYGWRCMEGFNCTGLSGCTCNDPSLTLPIRQYAHNGGKCSITGGIVYRGDAIPDMRGWYFYADYCTAQVFRMLWDGGTGFIAHDDITALVAPGGGLNINFITSFGEDADGELYICDQGGEVFKLVPGEAFTGLGCQLAGTNGEPVLYGEGTLAVGSPGALRLTNAAPSASAILFVSLGIGSANFKGGVLKTIPIALQIPLSTDPSGNIDLTWGAWPPGLPAGTELGFQYGIQDAGAPAGVALSNALLGTTP
jgi:glucose/arabinose dehydrogenase